MKNNRYSPLFNKGLIMDQMNYDIFMNALREVNPELASVVDFVEDKSANDDRVRTFEDCARVEQDIMNRLNSVNPLEDKQCLIKLKINL